MNGADQFIETPLTPEEAAASCHTLIRRFTELSKARSIYIMRYDVGEF